jgi:hypothetical protein
MLLVFTIAALETRRTPCGRYTTYDRTFGDYLALCGISTYVEAARE